MSLKTYLNNFSRRVYLKNLPQKRMGAGCLLFNRERKILILKPTYKDNWLLPGGVVEANESPRQTCIREVKEETGIDCQPKKLLCIDYVSDKLNGMASLRTYKIESVQFVFLGGIFGNETAIVLPKKEISAYQFMEINQAISMLSVHSQRRLESCLPYLDSQTTIYLENGKQP